MREGIRNKVSEIKLADLHVHTHFSDGTFAPDEAIRCAKEHGLVAIAITDHDVIDGIEPSLEAGKKYQVEVIPGVEITTEVDGREIHILGFYIDWKRKWFQNELKKICNMRLHRARKILNKLAKSNIRITMEELLQESGPGSMGRLHIAQVMHKKGFVSSINEAFKKYIGDKGPCYAGRFKLTPKQAIEMILAIGGIPVLAHPHLMRMDELIPGMIKNGLKGIEVYHSEHKRTASERYKALAEKHNLLITGGSDCHGLGKGGVLIGKVKVPYELVEKLKGVRS